MNKQTTNYSTTPYWWQDPRLKTSELSKNLEQLPAVVDIAIIGGGYTGLSAALTLARAGKHVAVLDMERPGWGCSGRNGGLIGPSFHRLGIQGLTHLYGYQKMVEIFQESLTGLDFLTNFIRDEAIDCDLNLCGRFRGASHPKHYTVLARQVDELSHLLNFPSTMVSRDEQRAEIGSDRYFGGTVYHLDGNLQPALLAQGIAYKAIKAGAQIFDHAYVSDVSKEHTTFKLTVAKKYLHAVNVLVATNGYTDKSLQSFRRCLIPIRSAMIATEELDPTLIQSLSPNLRSHGGTERLVDYYRPSPDGKRLLFGGRSLCQDDNPKVYAPYLRQRMINIYPQLTDVKISNAWSGVVAYTFDHIPHLGVQDGIHYAMGYCGSGVGRATYFGHKIALKLLADKKSKTAFDDLQLTTRPFYTGKPWFLPPLIRWHSIADRMGW